MKRILNKSLILIFCFLIYNNANISAQGVWTWMSGPNIQVSGGVYGVQGIPSINNYPEATYGPFCWTDLQGKFWFFGGTNDYADLWKFDPITLEWTWVKGTGSPNTPTVYGVQGIPNINNTPGSRGFSGCTWTDLNGDLWLYGGYSNGYNSDLWRYHIATNEWTWMSGAQGGAGITIYGNMGVPSLTNQPGPRGEIGSSWVDSQGRFWLYGGHEGNTLSDMWMYEPSTNMWTWMSGAQGTGNNPIYGPSGVFNGSNTPGSRAPYSMWIDGNDHLWLFGGLEGFSYYADLWQYDIAINQWAWMTGSQQLDAPGAFGNSCTTAPSYYPKARSENRASFIDAAGNLWMIGGGYSPLLGDVWIYLPSINEFAIISNGIYQNAAPVYGSLGVPAPTNNPGGRAGTGHWKDLNGNYWIFGGESDIGGRNDMWRYEPDFCLSNINLPPNANFSTNSTVCDSSCIIYNNQTTGGATNWEWSFPGGIPATYSGQIPPSICYNLMGTFSSQLIASNIYGSDTAYFQVVVQDCTPVADFTPDSSMYCQTDCVTFINTSSSTSTNFQWTFQNGNPSSSSSQNPPQICYDSTGSFTVQLIASNNYGIDTSISVINIQDCKPSASFSGTDTLCNTTCQTFTNSSSSNCTNWNWSFPGGIPSSFAGQNPPLICYGSGNFTATLIVSNNYGLDTSTFSFFIKNCNPPSAYFTQSDSEICNSECIDYTNASSSNSISFSWNFSGGIPSTFNGENPATVCYPIPGNYLTTLTATNTFGSNTYTQTIIVNYCGPSADYLISENSICIDKCVVFTDESNGNLTTWHWTFDGGTPSSSNSEFPPLICYHSVGTYISTLICENSFGIDTIKKIITVHPNPVSEIAPSNSNIYIGESIQLIASGGNSYSWSPVESVNNPLISNPIASPTINTTYYIDITSEFGCLVTDTAIVNVIKYINIPSAFSPNEDGKNDFFHLMNPWDIKSIDIKIFNRWGQIIFVSNDPYFSWDGKFQNESQEIGVYVWKINYTPLHSYQNIQQAGNLTLLR